jgi:enolase
LDINKNQKKLRKIFKHKEYCKKINLKRCIIKVKIKKIISREILDSRGNPTIEAEVFTSHTSGKAIVPSGASTGIYESLELRDKTKRYLGKGVQKVKKNIELINKKLKGVDVRNFSKIDQIMLDLDNTKNKSKLGANAILGVSLATARAAANATKTPLYRYLQKQSKTKRILLPVPFSNVINGGKHAGNKLAMQEFMITPIKAKSFSDGCRAVSETYHILKGIIEKKYGKNATNVGDEGGFAPPISKAEDAFRLIHKAIEKAGYSKILKCAMDPAASEFYKKGNYFLHKKYSGEKLIEYYNKLIKDYNVVSLEDPFDQNDFENFNKLLKSTKIQVVGDDLTVTNVKRINLAIKNKLCNALLLKVNQIGSLTESINSAILARNNDWNIMVSHRSGDTEDPFISDLAVGLGCGQIKLGAPCRGERTAKYNQLLRIEQELGKKAKYARW